MAVRLVLAYFNCSCKNTLYQAAVHKINSRSFQTQTPTCLEARRASFHKTCQGAKWFLHATRMPSHPPHCKILYKPVSSSVAPTERTRYNFKMLKNQVVGVVPAPGIQLQVYPPFQYLVFTLSSNPQGS